MRLWYLGKKMSNKKEEQVVKEQQPRERKEVIKISHASNTIQTMQKDICNLKNNVQTLSQAIRTLDREVIASNKRNRSLWDKFKALFY